MAQSRRCPQCGAELPADAPMGLCPKCVLNLGVGSAQGAGAGPTMPEGTPTGPQGSPAGHAFVPPTPQELAALFPQLEVLELLGQGGMGAVYKARQRALDRPVALKVLPPSFGADPAFAERFAREARSLARLNHPNIVGVYDFGQAGGFYYLVMEYVDGVNLRQMERSQQLSPKEALAIVPQICDALQFAHDEGIVHRDIKPENILIDTKGRVKIADFGLAKLLTRAAADYTLTQPQQVMGTVHYMAPEQVEHPAAVDQRADIYSLGVVFYEMLTGELPLGRFAPPSQKVQVDVRLDEVVLKTLEKEPDRRYQHASEVKMAVESVTSGPGVSPEAAPQQTPRQDAPAVPATESRLSQFALWGTILDVIGVISLCTLLFLGTVVCDNLFVTHYGFQPTKPLGVLIGEWICGIIGVLSLLAGMFCGMAGIPEIKKSDGRISGLPLAAGAALLLPLLAVVAILPYFLIRIFQPIACHLLRTAESTPGGPPVAPPNVIPLSFLVALVVCFFVGRAAWRKIAGRKETPAPTTLTAGQDAAGSRVRGPAFAAMAVGFLYLVLAVLAARLGILGPGQRGVLEAIVPGATGDFKMFLFLATSALAVAALFGGWMMLNCRWYGLAVFTSIITLPVGFWCLAVLSRPAVRAAFGRRAECEMRPPWRPRGVPQMVGGTAGIIASTGLASLLAFVGLWLINHYGPASYQVTDGSVFQMGAPAELEEVSPGKCVSRSDRYVIFPVAYGEGRTWGGLARPDLLARRLESLPRRRLTLGLNVVPSKGGGEMQVELDTLGYRYVDAEGREVKADAGLSLQVLLDWMAAAGVDVTKPAAKHQASNLLNMARECRTRKLMDLVKVSAFTVDSPGGFAGSVTLDPWQKPALGWGTVALWLAACALSVVIVVRRARRAAQEPGAAAPAERVSTRWSGFCIWGFALALCAVVGQIREWRGEELPGRILLSVVIGLAAALASVGLLQIRKGRRGRGAGVGVAALALSLVACAEFFITIHVPFDF